VDFRAATDTPDVGLADLTVDGQSIWQPQDPVHPKRPRLESIVVKKSGTAGNKIVSRQSWSAGILPANSSKPGNGSRGRGRGNGPIGWPRRGRGWGGGLFFWAPRGKY
jgi:hypothetical protein